MADLERFDEIDALLAGRSNAGSDDLSELVKAAKAVSRQTLAPEVERRHLAAIVEEAHTHASHTGLAPRSRSDKMRKIFRPAWVKAVAVLGVALAATTGLASAGVMPAPAQDALSEVASRLGVDMPRSENAGQKAEDSDATDEADEAGDDEAGDDVAGEDIEGVEPAGEENGKSVADDVHAVQADETLEGRDRGQAIAEAASQNRQNETHSHSPQGGPNATPTPTP